MRRIVVQPSRIFYAVAFYAVIFCAGALCAGWTGSATAQITKEMIAARNVPSPITAQGVVKEPTVKEPTVKGDAAKGHAAKPDTVKPDTSIWQRDIEATVAQAERDGRLILMHFWAPNCDDCRSMEREFFGNPEVAAALSEYYLCVPINGPQRPDVLRQLGLPEVFPTDLILRPDGTTLVGGRSGVVPPKEYLAQLTEVARRHQKAMAEARPAVNATSTPDAGNAAAVPMDADRFANSGRPAERSENDAATPALPGAGLTFTPIPPLPSIPQTPFPAGEPELPKEPSPAASPTTEPAPVFGDHFGTPPAAVAGNVLETGNVPEWGSAAAAAEPATAMKTPIADEMPWATVPATTPVTTPAETVPATMEMLLMAEPTVAALATTSPPAMSEVPALSEAGIAPPEMNVRSDFAAARNVADTSPVAPELAGFTESERELLRRAPPLALEGYSAVLLATQGRWIRGSTRYGATHRGQTYLFAGEQEVKLFLMDPERYAPALSGYDVVEAIESGRLVTGRREIAARMPEGRDLYQVWLFASEENYERFDAAPEKYIRAAVELMKQNDQQAAREARLLGESLFR